VINLLSNALKYTRSGGEVQIKIRKEKEEVVIEVEDTGIGIAEKDLNFIFERFYRADESRNKTTGGAGIGLTIAKSIVEAHGGKISVESELKKGSRFIVQIPNGA
jgi:signal transduction histidine kinase